MTLKDKLKEDMKAAFKSGDQATRSTLSFMLSVIQNRELEKRAKLMKAGAVTEAEVGEKSQLTDEEIVEALGTEIKKRKESIAAYQSADRSELAASEQQELDTLMRYMPEQLSDDAVAQLVKDAIAATGAAGPKDLGKVMGALAPKTKGRVDNAKVSALVKAALGA